MKLKNNVDSSDLSEAVKEYTIPAQHRVDGVSVPVSLVAEVAPDTNPVQMVPRMSWIYQARRVAQQTNAAGGAIVIDITLAAGQIGRLLGMTAYNSGTNTLGVYLVDEDNAIGPCLGYVTSAASRQIDLPSIGTTSSGSANIVHSLGFVIPSGAKLTIQQSGAGVDNDTLTIGIVMELFNLPTEPTWSKARSTNQADVTLAASTISEANTITVGRIW